MKSEVNIAIAYSKRSLFHNKVIRAIELNPTYFERIKEKVGPKANYQTLNQFGHL